MKFAVRLSSFFAALILMFSAGTVLADLEPYRDYDISDAVWSVMTIQVAENMDNAYLEAIQGAWASGNEIAKKLGHIEDYMILRSDLPQSGDFNLMLIIVYKSTSDLAPSKERYDALMAIWGEARAKSWAEFTERNSSGMREITGQYLMREITLHQTPLP